MLLMGVLVVVLKERKRKSRFHPRIAWAAGGWVWQFSFKSPERKRSGENLKETVDFPVEPARLSVRQKRVTEKVAQETIEFPVYVSGVCGGASLLIFDSLVLEISARDSEWSIRMSDCIPLRGVGVCSNEVRRKAKAKIELCVARQIFGFFKALRLNEP
jgi:hypothetical protein